MDTLILEEKLESLRRSISRVEKKRAESAGQLRADVDRQDILTLNLTRAVQLCVDMAMHIIAQSDETLPQTMGQTFDALAQLGIIDEHLIMSLPQPDEESRRGRRSHRSSSRAPGPAPCGRPALGPIRRPGGSPSLDQPTS